jgi:hypothetical protein
MKYLSLVGLIVAALILGMCGSPTAGQPSHRVHLLVTVDGTVLLERENWRQSVPVGVGTILRVTDLIDVQGGKAVVLCADLSVKVVTAPERPPCPTDTGVLEYDGAKFGSFQRSASKDVPYILHPRNTLIVDPRPLLRWNATGATSYTVSIVEIVEKEKTIWSQANVVGDRLQYPENAPALQPGIDYLLVVQANATGRMSTEDPAKGLGFQLMDNTKRQEVTKQRDAILSLTALDEQARKLALAVYYAGVVSGGRRAMYGEAWLRFEDVAQTASAPAIQRQIGDLLHAMLLPIEAEKAYSTTLELAKSLGDLETLAAAQAGLWRVTGDKAWLDKAITTYELLGDQNQADALRKEKP